MLDERGVTFTYREYTRDPLSEEELREVMAMLDLEPSAVLRARGAKEAGLTGEESSDELIGLMASNPRLLQRPIAIVGDKAVVARPVETLLTLL